MKRLALVALGMVLGCSDGGLTAPQNRVLDEGLYTMRLTGCFGCDDFTTIGNLLLFKPPGVEVVMRVSNPGPDAAQVEVLSATYLGGSGTTDVLDRWEETSLTLEWTEQLVGGPGFVVRTNWASGRITHGFRRTSAGTGCEFALLYLVGNDVGFGGVCDVVAHVR